MAWRWIQANQPFREHLFQQACRLLDRIPEYSGIAIDRFDRLLEYNHHANDGLTWIEDRPVRALLHSAKEALAKLHEVAATRGKVVYASASFHRADLAAHIDGFFNEGGYCGPNINMGGFLSLFKPFIVWSHPTEVFEHEGLPWLRIRIFSGEIIEEPARRFFQRHLLMGAWPMAPLAGNDHSISYSLELLRLYRDHALLFRKIRGKRWVLSHDAIQWSRPDAELNLFATRDGYAVPIFCESGGPIDVALRLHRFEIQSVRIFTAGEEHPLEVACDCSEETTRISFSIPKDRAAILSIESRK